MVTLNAMQTIQVNNLENPAIGKENKKSMIQCKLRLALGTFKDHASIGKALISSYKYSLKKCNNLQQGRCFADIEIAVLRATAHDSTFIDDKHMHEILFLVSNSPVGSISFLAEKISCRLARTRDPLVAIKTLLLIHRLLRGGNRYFEEQLRGAYRSGHLQLNTLRIVSISDSKGSFLRKYVAYLEERIGWLINQAGRLEPVMESPQGLHFQQYVEKSIDLVFQQLPKCQLFIDKVLNFLYCDDLPYDTNNVLVRAALSNILKESFQVYTTYNEGTSALINLFFDLTRQARALACEILKRASQQSQELHHLYQKCKQIVGNSYSSNLSYIPKNMEYPSVQLINMEYVLGLELCSTSSCSFLKNPTPPFSSSPGPSMSSSVKSVTSLPCPVLNGITKPFMQQQPANMSEKVEKGVRNCSFSSNTSFPWKLETKISKVWVVFDDDHQEDVSHAPS